MADDADTPAAGGGMMAKMGTGELLMGVGAAWILVVVYVIGNRLASEYGASVMTWSAMLALVIVASGYFTKMGSGSRWSEFYPWVATTAAWGLVILAVLDLLNGIVNDFSSSGEFYEITYYIAAAVAGVGAWQTQQQSS